MSAAISVQLKQRLHKSSSFFFPSWLLKINLFSFNWFTWLSFYSLLNQIIVFDFVLKSLLISVTVRHNNVFGIQLIKSENAPWSLLNNLNLFYRLVVSLFFIAYDKIVLADMFIKQHYLTHLTFSVFSVITLKIQRCLHLFVKFS